MLKKLKVIFISVMAFCLVLCFVPTAAFATEEQASDTEITSEIFAVSGAQDSDGEIAEAQESGEEPAVQASEEETADETAGEAKTQEPTASKSARKALTKSSGSAVPMTADAGSAVCKIGSTEYASLKAAVAAAKDGDKIVMLADETQTETITIPKGKSLTITDDGNERTVKAGTTTLFNVEGSLTMDGSKLFFDGGSATDRNIADVTGTLNIKEGTVNGGTYNTKEGIIYVHGGTFNLSGGKIQNCTGDNQQWSAPIRIGNLSTMNMTGGEICNNNCFTGAGIAAGTDVTDPESEIPTVNISGGKIHHNVGSLGVALVGIFHAKFNISGGTFSDNKENGKVSKAGTMLFNRSEITMTGGLIENNEMQAGGGMFISRECKATLTGGMIRNNTARVYGGGIFMEDSLPTAYVENALVTANHASIEGGGLFCCPTGAAQVKATEGMAIFDNSAEQVGDDITNLCTDRQQMSIVLSERILGGGLANYYEDGGLKAVEKGASNYWYGEVTDTPRYNEASAKYDPAKAASESLALKSLASENAKTAAKNHAKLIIEGNSAKLGGGIACNGSLFTKKLEEDVYSLKVKKVWDGVDAEEQVPVEVALVIDGVELDSVVLSEDNNWEAVFENLPNPETVGSIEVVEKTEGFDVAYSEITGGTPDEPEMSVTVTNSHETITPPDDPTPQDEPDKPTPDTPTPQDKPDTPEKTVTKKTVTKHVAKTGDERDSAGFAGLAALALVAGALALRRKSGHAE